MTRPLRIVPDEEPDGPINRTEAAIELAEAYQAMRTSHTLNAIEFQKAVTRLNAAVDAWETAR